MTPLQQQLAARSVEAAELSGIGIDADRARQLLAGADPTIDEVRRIAATYAIPVRDLIAPVTTLRERSLKLRENIRELARRDGDREIGSILARAAVIADAVRRGPSERIQVALEVGSKTFEKAAALADLCRFDLFGADDEEPFIDLERKVVLHAGAYVLVIQQRTVEGAALVLGEVPILFIAERNDPRMRFTLAHEHVIYLSISRRLSPAGSIKTYFVQPLRPIDETKILQTPLQLPFCFQWLESGKFFSAPEISGM